MVRKVPSISISPSASPSISLSPAVNSTAPILSAVSYLNGTNNLTLITENVVATYKDNNCTVSDSLFANTTPIQNLVIENVKNNMINCTVFNNFGFTQDLVQKHFRFLFNKIDFLGGDNTTNANNTRCDKEGLKLINHNLSNSTLIFNQLNCTELQEMNGGNDLCGVEHNMANITALTEIAITGSCANINVSLL